MLPLYTRGIASSPHRLPRESNGDFSPEAILPVTRTQQRSAIWPAVLAQLLTLAAPALFAQTAPAKKPPKAEEKYTPTLSREIHHQILTLPFYSVFDSIVFTLNGGKVTLSGEVLRTNLKENAEAAVKSIEGVSVVIDHIEVLPVSPADDDLRSAVYRALYEDPTLARYAIQAVPSIHIIVKSGNVALEGAVNSESDKTLAGQRAAVPPNVVAVKNNLLVQPKGNAAE
jgi:hyperosmotically inducible periplasmic protein